MSLKAFHIVFIVVSILLCFGFGAWLVLAQETSALSISGAIVSVTAGVFLIMYAKRFLQKFKKVSYL
ncbi:MAG: hypothetical protein L0Y80_00285 [Ignavibacteriae bacterium]|nr:hypothetical protein [Ignavibacteriota bacterium]